MPLTNDLMVREINSITKKPFDFWLLNLEHDYRNLPRFFEKANPPKGAELFTNECVFPGKEIDAILKEKSWHQMTERQERAEERRLFIEYAKNFENFSIQDTLCPSKEIKNALQLAQKSGVRLWLGTQSLNYITKWKNPSLYNSYILIENGKFCFVHKKRFLWPTEEGISEVIGREGTNAIATEKYDGIFENRAYLICQEAPRFYSPKWGKSPTHIPEVRDAKPDFVIIPAHWVGEDGDTPAVRTEKERMLRQIALAISRRIKDPIDKFSAVRRQGCLT